MAKQYTCTVYANNVPRYSIYYAAKMYSFYFKMYCTLIYFDVFCAKALHRE